MNTTDYDGDDEFDLTPNDAATDPAEIAVAETPAETAISHEEYTELLTLRLQQNEIKANKLDYIEFISGREAEIAAAREQLEAVDVSLKENAETLQTRFSEIVTPLGLSGVISIADEAIDGKHLVTVVEKTATA